MAETCSPHGTYTRHGNSEHGAHASKKIDFFEDNKERFMTALDLIKCLEQIKWQRLLLTCVRLTSIIKYYAFFIIIQIKLGATPKYIIEAIS